MSEDAGSESLGQVGRGEEVSREPGRPRSRRDAVSGGGFALRVYKAGQGYYTRLGTAIGVGVLAVCGAVFLHRRLSELDLTAQTALYVQYGVAAGFLVAMGVLVYWIVGLNRKANDFFIATEGEMKKVRWSTRKEIVRSTKVVIVAVIIMGTFLFAWDLLFMLFFSTIKVLKGSPGLSRIFGGES